jgi:acetylornithine aminotransferase
VPATEHDASYAARLLEAGIVVSPGSFFGAGQERFVRLALVPSAEECEEAVARWSRL